MRLRGAALRSNLHIGDGHYHLVSDEIVDATETDHLHMSETGKPQDPKTNWNPHHHSCHSPAHTSRPATLMVTRHQASA